MRYSPVTIGLFAGAAVGLAFGVFLTVNGGKNFASVLLMPVFGALVGAVIGMVLSGIFGRGE